MQLTASECDPIVESCSLGIFLTQAIYGNKLPITQGGDHLRPPCMISQLVAHGFGHVSSFWLANYFS